MLFAHTHFKLQLAAAFLLLALVLPAKAHAHFGVLIPFSDIVTDSSQRSVTLDVRFMHPFEGQYLEMARPRALGVLVRGKKKDLTVSLEMLKSPTGQAAWQAGYDIESPGDHVFYMEPEPYWEPSEETFIIHYTKVVVSAFGLERGWDAEVGLKAEIVPLTRPYGLWTGNAFQGVVKINGKPLPNAEVEVEYLNEERSVKAPSAPYVTQVIRADSKGVFTYAMPREGWWGFAALAMADYKLEHDGKRYPVELGAVIWVHTRDMR